MPKVTEAHLEARRQQILEAALTCFARTGFHRTTMQDICQQAGLSPGALYRYFGSKEEIIQELAEESRRRNVALIQSIRERDDTLQIVDELSGVFFSWLDKPEAYAANCLDVELWAEALRNRRILEILRRSLDSHRQPFTEIIRRAQERGEINPSLEADAVARVMVSLFMGLVLQKGLEPEVDVWRYVAVVKAMMGGAFWQGRRLEGSDGDVPLRSA